MSSSSQGFEHASCNPLRWTLTSMGVLHLCLHLFLSLMSGLHVLLGLISISEGGRRAQEGENSNCRERGFEDDEQCKDAEGMNVTVG